MGQTLERQLGENQLEDDNWKNWHLEEWINRRMYNWKIWQLEDYPFRRWHIWNIRQLEDKQRNWTFGRKHNWNKPVLEENEGNMTFLQFFIFQLYIFSMDNLIPKLYVPSAITIGGLQEHLPISATYRSYKEESIACPNFYYSKWYYNNYIKALLSFACNCYAYKLVLISGSILSLSTNHYCKTFTMLKTSMKVTCKSFILSHHVFSFIYLNLPNPLY